VVPEFPNAAGGVANDLGFPLLVVMIDAEVLVAGGAFDHVVDDDEDGVCYGDGGAFLPPPGGDALVHLSEVRAPRSSSGVSSFHQDRANPATALSRLVAQALPATLVIAGTDLRPGGEVVGGGEAAHVGGDLGDEMLGGRAADAGNLIEPIEELIVGFEALLDLRGERGDLLVVEVDLSEQAGKQEALVIGHHPGQGRFELSVLRSQATARELRHLRGGQLPLDQGPQQRQARDAEHVAGHVTELDVRSLQHVLDSIRGAAALLDQFAAMPGEFAEFPLLTFSRRL